MADGHFADCSKAVEPAPERTPPQCPKCKCRSVNFRDSSGRDGSNLEDLVGECYRSPCRYKGKYTEFLARAVAVPEPANLSVDEQNLGNLLAIIHRDGGHYWGKHGVEKAITDAIEIVDSERAAQQELGLMPSCTLCGAIMRGVCPECNNKTGVSEPAPTPNRPTRHTVGAVVDEGNEIDRRASALGTKEKHEN